MDDRILTVVATVGLFVLALASIAVIQIRARGKAREEADGLRREHDRLVSVGMRTEDGCPTCVVCRLRASEYAPITGVSWMDKLPLLNRLYSLAPRHVIVDNTEGDLCFCRLHKQMAVASLQEAHAELRAQRASFIAAQEGRIASLDGGELVQMLIRKFREHEIRMRSLRIAADTPMPTLPAHRDDGITTTVVSSPSMVPEED